MAYEFTDKIEDLKIEEEQKQRHCPACKSPLIKEKKIIKGTNWEVEVWVCSEQKMTGCLT